MAQLDAVAHEITVSMRSVTSLLQARLMFANGPTSTFRDES
jgi:hypothetical protein